MRISRRKALGWAATIGASSPSVLAQVSGPAAQASGARTPDQELEIARQQRQRDAQRIATVKLAQSIEPAFHFRP
jgi:hypothetical protein